MKRKGGPTPSDTNAESLVRPHLRFYHSESLRLKTVSVLDALESSPHPTKHKDALIELVLELTEGGFEYYFLKPVQAAKVGFIAEQSTRVGIASILRVMGPVARRVISGMDAQQLLTISTFIRGIMG